MISLIVAMDRNRLIGNEGDLPWRIPEDLRYFRAQTLDKPIVMGRATHESIGRALDRRHNIVVSRTLSKAPADTDLVRSIELALGLVASAPEVVIIGGAQIYQAAMPYVERIYLTQIEAEFTGDTYFPEINWADWQEVLSEAHLEATPYGFRFQTLDRVGGALPVPMPTNSERRTLGRI